MVSLSKYIKKIASTFQILRSCTCDTHVSKKVFFFNRRIVEFMTNTFYKAKNIHLLKITNSTPKVNEKNVYCNYIRLKF
jgi:hypothetical protein